MTKRLILAVPLLLLGACGGRAIETGPDGSGGSDVVDASAGSAGGGDRPSTPTGSLPKRDLGACDPGFSRAMFPSRQCNWLSEDGICFDTKDLACNCVCPSDHDSVCLSGFYGGPGSATVVRCN